MTQSRKVVHYDAGGKGLYIPGHAECGAYKRMYYVNPDLPMSSDWAQVTCKCCKRTAAFLSAVALKASQEARN